MAGLYGILCLPPESAKREAVESLLIGAMDELRTSLEDKTTYGGPYPYSYEVPPGPFYMAAIATLLLRDGCVDLDAMQLQLRAGVNPVPGDSGLGQLTIGWKVFFNEFHYGNARKDMRYATTGQNIL